MYTQHENYIERSDGALIPIDPSNADYQAFEAWKSAGNVPALADTSEPTPPDAIEPATAQQKLVEFLKANPDVLALVTK